MNASSGNTLLVVTTYPAACVMMRIALQGNPARPKREVSNEQARNNRRVARDSHLPDKEN